MNKSSKVLMIILIGLSLAGYSSKVSASPSMAPCLGNPILVVLEEQHPVTDPNNPRSPSVLPISCVFSDNSETLYFTFLFPMGDVTITLTEDSAGVVSSDEYSTASCLVSIPVPGSGSYEITLVLESGAELSGQFVY